MDQVKFLLLMNMNIHTQNLPVCNSGQYIYITGLCNFFFALQDLIDRINSYFQRIAFQRNLLLIGFFLISCHKFFPMKVGSLHRNGAA